MRGKTRGRKLTKKTFKPGYREIVIPFEVVIIGQIERGCRREDGLILEGCRRGRLPGHGGWWRRLGGRLRDGLLGAAGKRLRLASALFKLCDYRPQFLIDALLPGLKIGEGRLHRVQALRRRRR